jgi:hypothetical protein
MVVYMNDQINITGLSCGIFKKELEYLFNNNKIEIQFNFFTSMLHLKPTLLEKKLNNSINQKPHNGYILVFGDCHPRMNGYDSLPNVQRVTGVNCCEMFLGSKIYNELKKDGIFFLLPEWTHKFKNIFTRKLGFNSTNIKDFMYDMQSKICYLDTGIIEVPNKQLKSIADFTGLKVDVIKIELSFLTDAVNNAHKKLKEKLNAY